MFGHGPEIADEDVTQRFRREPREVTTARKVQEERNVSFQTKATCPFFVYSFFHTKKNIQLPLSGLQKISKDDKSIDGCAIYFHGRRSYRSYRLFFSVRHVWCQRLTFCIAHQLPVCLTLSKALLQGGQIVSWLKLKFGSTLLWLIECHLKAKPGKQAPWIFSEFRSTVENHWNVLLKSLNMLYIQIRSSSNGNMMWLPCLEATLLIFLI